MKVKARLSLCGEGGTVRSFPIPDEGTMVGRAADNFVQLTDREVSKRHAEIRPDGAGWVIRDTGSRNGVTVNGRRVEESPLKNGDRIMIGPFLLVFETRAGDADWVPFHVIDLSLQAGQQTIPRTDRRPGAPPA